MGCGASTNVPPAALTANTPIRQLQQSAKHLIGPEAERINHLLAAKQSLRSASSIRVGSQESIEGVRDAIVRMEQEREQARAAGAYGGPEAAHLEARITSLAAMAKARDEAAASTTAAAAASVATDTKELRRIVSGVLSPALTSTATAKAVDAPEASALKRRLAELEGWLIAKDAMAVVLAKAHGLSGSTPLPELTAAVKEMAKAAAIAKAKRCEAGPEAHALREAQAKVAPLAAAKEALVRAMEGQGKEHKWKAADVRKAIERMELARERARAREAYDGKERADFEARLAALAALATAKEAMTEAVRAAQNAGVSNSTSDLRIVCTDVLAPALAMAVKAKAEETAEASALKKRLTVIEGWMTAKGEMEAAVAATVSADDGATSMVELKVAIKTIEKAIHTAMRLEAWFLQGTGTMDGAVATVEARVLAYRLDLAKRRVHAKAEVKAAAASAGTLSTATPVPRLEAALDRMCAAKAAAKQAGAFEGSEAEALAGKIIAAKALLGLSSSPEDTPAALDPLPAASQADLARPIPVQPAVASVAPRATLAIPTPAPPCAPPAAQPQVELAPPRPLLLEAPAALSTAQLAAFVPLTDGIAGSRSDSVPTADGECKALTRCGGEDPFPSLLPPQMSPAEFTTVSRALKASKGDPFPSLTPPLLPQIEPVTVAGEVKSADDVCVRSREAATADERHMDAGGERGSGSVESSTDSLQPVALGVPLFTPFVPTGAGPPIVEGAVGTS